MVVPDYFKMSREMRMQIVEDKVIEQIYGHSINDEFDSHVLKEPRIISSIHDDTINHGFKKYSMN